MWKKYFVVILLGLLVFFNGSSAAEAKPESVTIAFIEHVPPSWYRNSEGDLQGIGPDYWRLWSKKTGIKVIFRISSWQDSLDAVAGGEADIHSGMIPSDERRKLFDYSDKEYFTTEEFLYVRKDLGISSPISLDKIPVLTDGGISMKMLKDRYKNIILINAESYDVIVDQIKNKTADAFVMDDIIAAYHMANVDSIIKYEKIYSVFKQSLMPAVQKGNSEMLRVLNDGQNLITDEEYNLILEKYIATRVEYPEWFAKYFPIALISMVGVLLLIYAFLLRFQVMHKTKELAEAVESERELRLEKEYLLIQQSRLAKLGEMVNAVTHQWKQPLNAISMLASSLQDVEFEEKIDKRSIIRDANDISKQVDFMAKTMDDFSGFSSPQGHLEVFSLCEVTKNAFSLMESTIRYNNVDVDIVCVENVEVCGPKHDFIHVILNLISNSLEAFRANGVNNPLISISAAREDEHEVKLTYSDNGGGLKGVTPEDIFEPYISTKVDKSGSGIGMYLSKNIIVKQFNGSIEVESSGDTTTFYIVLKG